MAVIETLTIEGDMNNVVSAFKDAVDVHYCNHGNKHWGSINKRDIYFPYLTEDFRTEAAATEAADKWMDKHRRAAFAARFGNKWVVRAECRD